MPYLEVHSLKEIEEIRAFLAGSQPESFAISQHCSKGYEMTFASFLILGQSRKLVSCLVVTICLVGTPAHAGPFEDALDSIGDAAKDFGDQLTAISAEDLHTFFNGLDLPGMEKLFGGLSAPQVSDLSQKVEWEKLDPIKVPWNTIDLGKVKWNVQKIEDLPLPTIDAAKLPWLDLPAARVKWETLLPEQYTHVPWKDLNVEEVPWERLNPSLIPWHELEIGKVPWTKLNTLKFKWDKLKPKAIPMEQFDHFNVKWDSAAPSKAVLDAKSWLDGAAVRTGEAAGKTGDTIESSLLTQRDAIADGHMIADFLAEGKDFDQHVKESLLKARDQALDKSADWEESVRKDVNQTIEKAKGTWWYQRLQDALQPAQDLVEWHFMEPPQTLPPFVFDSRFKDREPVYFVNGMLNTLYDARQSAMKISEAVERPVILVYNPSFLNGDAQSDEIGVTKFETGTPGIAGDFGEVVYDRLWPTGVDHYFSELTNSSFDLLLGRGKDDHTRLQKNPTTRQVTYLLFHAEKPISIVTHSQGCMIMRNACFATALLGKNHTVNRQVAWLACGNPLGDSEVWPRPARFKTFANKYDAVGKLIAFKGTELNFNKNYHKIDRYLPQVRENSNQLFAAADLGRSNFPFVDLDEPSSETQFVSLRRVINRVRSRHAPLQYPNVLNLMPYDAQVVSGDFDGDSVDDLAIARAYPGEAGQYGPLSLYLLLMERGRIKSSAEIARPFSTPGELVAADFNGDGLCDIGVFAAPKATTGESVTPGQFSVRLSDGEGGLNELLYMAEQLTDPSYLQCGGKPLAGDVDGDGFADLILTEPLQSAVVVARAAASGVLVDDCTRAELHPPTPRRRLFPADVNADGRVDLVMLSERTPVAGVVACCNLAELQFLNSGKGASFNLAKAPGATTYSGNTNCDNLIRFDMDQDGKSDFVRVEQSPQGNDGTVITLVPLPICHLGRSSSGKQMRFKVSRSVQQVW